MEVGETSRITTSNSLLIPRLDIDPSLRRSTTSVFCRFTTQIPKKSLNFSKKNSSNGNITPERNMPSCYTGSRKDFPSRSAREFSCPFGLPTLSEGKLPRRRARHQHRHRLLRHLQRPNEKFSFFRF